MPFRYSSFWCPSASCVLRSVPEWVLSVRTLGAKWARIEHVTDNKKDRRRRWGSKSNPISLLPAWRDNLSRKPTIVILANGKRRCVRLDRKIVATTKRVKKEKQLPPYGSTSSKRRKKCASVILLKSVEMSSVFWWTVAMRSNCSAISATESDLTEERKAWQMLRRKPVFWGYSSSSFIWHGPCVTRWSANSSERCWLEH